MKPYDELTRFGRIRRMRGLAQSALNAYGLSDARFKFLRQAGNTMFRVYEASPEPGPKDDLYAPGQYMLRIHQLGYQTPEAIELELAWLAGMCQDGDLPVPEPVRTLDGNLLTRVSFPGIPEERVCSLLRWVKGRELVKEEIQSHHYQAFGELLARLHNYSIQWHKPAGLSKRKFDWDGLFNTNNENINLTSEAWSLLPPEYVKPFEIVSRRVKQVMDAWGRSPDVYGLIHADLSLEANVLFWKGNARIIDFDDSGFGYYLFDLSIVLEDSQEDQIKPQLREALLEGYTRIRPIPEDQLKYLDLFLAAYAVYWSLWAADATHIYQQHNDEIFERMARYYTLVKNYLAKNMTDWSENDSHNTQGDIKL